MQKNIETVRKEKGVSLADIADLLDLKSQTVREKIDGRSDFKFGEAVAVRDKFFPEYDLRFLFSNNNRKQEKILA